MDMLRSRKLQIAAVVGVAAGFVAPHFVLSMLASLFLWAVAGISLGHFTNGTEAIVKTGAVYGFFLTVSFLYFNFGAGFDKFFQLLILTAALSLVGMLAGTICAAIGSFLKPYAVLEPVKEYF